MIDTESVEQVVIGSGQHEDSVLFSCDNITKCKQSYGFVRIDWPSIDS